MKKVLIALGGVYHPFESCGDILKQCLECTGQFSVQPTFDPSAFLDLSEFDAVIVYTGGRDDLTPDQEQGLLEFVKAGGGFLGIHCATASFRSSDGYMEMVGSEFANHGPVTEFAVEITADADDIVPRVRKQFSVTDEFYIMKSRTNAATRMFMEGWWHSERKPMGYVRDYGKGRVFYTALGHDERVFNHPDFQELVYKGLRYVTQQPEPGPVRIGLVGYGPLYNMGKLHGGDIGRTHGLKLTAVCDKVPARLDAAREELGSDLKTFSDAREMAESGQIDVGVTIVPHCVHFPVAKALLEAGCHVIVEKPFVVHVKEADELISIARERGLMLSTYHSRHWDADIWTLRQIVDAGTIGDVFSIEVSAARYSRPTDQWRSNKEIAGGALYDMGAHYFEKVFQLVPRFDGQGKPINRRASLYGNFTKKVWWNVTTEDLCRAYVRFDGGVEAQVFQSNVYAAARPSWSIAGTRGGILMPSPQGPAQVTTVGPDGRLSTTTVPLVEGLSWQSFYKNIADHLLAGMPLIITPGVARATIQCIEGCETAARENRVVEVEFEF